MKWGERLTCGVLGGLIVYLALTIPQLEFDPKLSIASVLQLFVTIAIALLVQNYLSHRYSEFRIEKDLILGKIKEASDIAKETRAAFISAYSEDPPKQLNPRQMGNLLRGLANVLFLVQTLLKESRPDFDEVRLKQVRTSYFTYKASVTDLKGSVAEQYGRQEQTYRRLSVDIFLLIMQINRLR